MPGTLYVTDLDGTLLGPDGSLSDTSAALLAGSPEAAADDAERTGATQVPPFDHPVIMAAQGTVALEAADQLRTEHGRELGTMVLPVGGGGLLGGCGAWLRERSPATRIIGVEPAGAVSMAAAVRAGRPVTLHDLDRFVDGAAKLCEAIDRAR